MPTRSALVTLATLVLLADGVGAATLSGRVVDDHAGAALPSADVRILKVGVRGIAAELETDGEGRFVAEGLPDGEYRIEVSKPNHIQSSVRTTLSAAAPSNLLLRLVRCGAINGRVLDGNGQPIRGAIVFGMRMGSGAPRPERTPGRYAHVDSEGRYRLFNLPPGQYIVAASYGASTMMLGMTGEAPPAAGVGSGVQLFPSNTRPQPFTITSGETFPNVDFSVLPSNLYAVSGKVQAGASPQAKGRFWLALALTEQPAIAVAATTANEDGSFRFAGVPPGSYEVFASGPTQARGGLGAELNDEAQFARTRVTVGSQDVEGLALTTEKGRSVVFTLRAPAAGCASGGQIVLSSLEDWGAQLERRSPIPVNEAVTVTRLAPARYRVSVTGLGETCYVPEGTVLDVAAARDTAPAVIAAVPAGTIQGVLTGKGSPAGVSIVLADVTDRGEPVQVASADANSRFTFGPLRPGRYRLSAKVPGAAQSRWTDETSAGVFVDVTGGAPVRVELSLP